jgi:hypothetical protein
MLSVIDIIRTHFPTVVETTERTIASGVTGIQIIGGVRNRPASRRAGNRAKSQARSRRRDEVPRRVR